MPDGERHGRGRMRRGDVRPALLIALLEGPGHGYELIQALERTTDGRWRPSPGSVYPSLQMLADEGLVTASDQDGKRVFELTDTGRAQAEERLAAGGVPWATMDGGRAEEGGLRAATRELHLAAKQVGLTGSPETVERATAIVTQARKELYRLLAE
jgi:DNA-binding PadR family transcriptional regulator